MTRHDDMYCADSYADEPEGYFEASCLDGTRYVTCGTESCPGPCEAIGPCPCRCHREYGDE